jgi:hypothetical protein
MRTTIRFASFAACLVVATLPGAPAAGAQEQPIFEKGKTVAYEVTLPKVGVIGSTDPVGYPLRHPAREDDFEKRFLRVTFLDSRPIPDGQRFVLRLDQIDKYARLTLKGLYYAYVNTPSGGARTLGRLKDDGVDVDDLGVAARLPFPFTCTRPPARGFKTAQQDGNLTRNGIGTSYLIKTPGLPSAGVFVEATCFDKQTPRWEDRPNPVRWYGPEIADVSRTNATTRILFRETQEWATPSDWLWKKMERFDSEGHLLMRCVLMTNTPGPQPSPTDGKGL